MDDVVRAQVTEWVEKKIGRIVDEDLKNIDERDCSQFNVRSYVDGLEEKYFTRVEVERLKHDLIGDFRPVANEFDSYDSDKEENDFLEFDNQEYQMFSIDESVKNLESESKEIRVKALQGLEIYAEELISHKSWVSVQKILLKVLNDKEDTSMHTLVLKVFLKLLTSTDKPQIVCEGFMSVSKTLSSLLKNDNVSYEEIYDLRVDRWLDKDSSSPLRDDLLHRQKFQNPLHLEIPIRLMWLLIYCQRQMPEKWIRFNEKKLRKIIFSFVHLLSSSSSSSKENGNVSALELLSILNPTASWCRSWCHTAVGRNLLCSVLRKYKSFFIRMIDGILRKIQPRRLKQLQSVRSNETIRKNIPNFPEKKVTDENRGKVRTKQVRSAPVDATESDGYLIFWRADGNSKWLTESIPKRAVSEAVFWHSVCVVASLIQYRCGQALFPVQTTARRRSLSVQHLSTMLIEHLENLKYEESDGEGFGFGVAYRTEVSEKVNVFKTVRNNLQPKMERSPKSQT